MSMWPFNPPRDAESWVLAYGGSIVLVLLGLLAVIFWAWALIHAIRSPDLADVPKILWVLVIVLLPVVGAMLYALLRPGSTLTAPTPRV